MDRSGALIPWGRGVFSHHRLVPVFPMKLSAAQKEQFFHELAESVRSGIPLPQALQRKAAGRVGELRTVASRMVAGSPDQTATEYFRAVPEVFSELDREIVAGGEKGGRLDQAFAYLRDYYQTLARARRRAFAQLAYPLFILHLGAVLLAVPALMSGGLPQFLAEAVGFLLVFYFLLFLIWMSLRTASRAADVNPSADGFLRVIPGVGGTFLALFGSRFCMLMGLLVKSGVGILTAMDRSASASGSALFRKGALEASGAVRDGGSLGQAVMMTGAFPEAIDRAFQTGEETGRLDDEMQRQAERYTDQLNARLEGLASWLPRIIYVMILLALGWRIISFYVGYFGTINSLLSL